MKINSGHFAQIYLISSPEIIEMFRYLLSLFFLLCFLGSKAQKAYKLEVHFSIDNPLMLKSLHLANSYPDTVILFHELDRIVSVAQFKGYLLAEVSDRKWDGSTLRVTLKLNELFKLLKLKNGNINEAVLKQAGYRDKLFTDVAYNPAQLEALFRSILRVYENTGYPFASVSLDSINIEKEQVTAQLLAAPNRYFVLDSLQIVGDAKVSNLFLQSYLNLKKGTAYNEAAVRTINNRIQELPFLGSGRNSRVNFRSDEAHITLFLNKKNANQFDGIIGFAPNSESGKVQITGDVKLKLQNVFRRAERIDFNFKGLPKQSRELSLAANLPNLLKSPLGIDLSFELFKQDTSFQNVNTRLGFNYAFSGNNRLRFFIDSRSGSLISVSQYKNATRLPPFADVNTTLYGAGITREKLDYRFNPSKGYSIQVDASVGNKQIKRNPGLPAILYDGLTLKSSQYRVEGHADFFIPLSKRSVFTAANQTGIIFGGNLFKNELYRIGGFRTLRGFDEQSILANQYTIFNAEYRYLLERNSCLFAFINQGFLSQKTREENLKDNPVGFGAGINFETKGGIVSLSYALGKQQNNTVNLQRGKIHFGIITIF